MRKIAAFIMVSALLVSSGLEAGILRLCAPANCVWVSSTGTLSVEGQASNTTHNGDMTEFSFSCIGNGTCYTISEDGTILEINTTTLQKEGPRIYISTEKE